eukprot:CAMPEP_0196572410 /NCGR_PEP_ID=MMETSP1081-20130531/2476_1 /TAXON_ID=36882 /ORGANISM="Pyramimonas amylifera, Strain CCMP720" /LENGTH=104 /DNA_ID=CAMNT_0041889731 /DNA_START=127 /DNA_END=441 /DNA_ORIENTATION=-
MNPVTSVYRELIRSCRKAFKEDHAMFTSSITEIRNKFEVSRMEVDPYEVAERLREGREAASFIASFVVQGTLNDKGNYAVTFEEHHCEKAFTYESEDECGQAKK